MTPSELKLLTFNITATFIGLVVLFIVGCILYFIFSKKMETSKQRSKIKFRILYVGVFVFLVILAKIWVNGLTHIFTMLSIVAAGLVITNKETVMNFAGCLIIYWRGLFSEGDFIQLAEYSGYVENIGILYFNIYETHPDMMTQATGRSVRIPNGLVITHAVTTLSPYTNICQYKLAYLAQQKQGNLARKIALGKQTLKKILDEKYKERKSYSCAYIKSHNRKLADLISLDVKSKIRISEDNPNDFYVDLYYYCYPMDTFDIEQEFFETIIDKFRAEES